MEEEVLLHTLKFTVSEVGKGMIVNIPAVKGTYPVTAVGSPLNDTIIASVVNVPVAAAVWAEVQVSDEIALVERVFAPLAMVIVPLTAAEELLTQLVVRGPIANKAAISGALSTRL